MESSTQKSPLWRKPSDIMKLRQLKSRKRILQRRFGEQEEEDEESIKGHHHRKQSGIQGNGDCRNNNPFRCSPRKRQRKNESEPRVPSLVEDYSCDSTLFQLLQVTSNDSDSQRSDEQSASSEISQNLVEENENVASTSDGVTKWQTDLPYDWSLKTALRLTSPLPFPWNSGRISTPEEASGVTGYVRCLDLHSRGGTERFDLDTSPNAQLFQCCQVWIHPSLPWLKLFPRYRSRTVSTATSVSIPPQIYKSLHSDWAESFRSLFHLLRARQCPYFYVCVHGFTILFRAPGMGSNPRIHALLTPTTRGLRTALSEEGIQFKLPLCNNHDSKEEDEDDDELHLDEGESTTENEELPKDDVVSWLKSVGVEENMLSQLDRDPNSDMQKEIDYRPQSLVYVEDGDVHALFNFLLNSKSCTVTTGPLAGIPPTLLAPVAFTGSTLRSLKMRQQVAQRESEKVYVFDLIGPILPHTIHYLDHLLRSRVQDSRYEMRLSTLETTSPFSLYSATDTEEAPSIFGQQSLSDCGLTFEVIQGMCLRRKSVVLREVKSSGNGYCWES